MYIHEFAQKCMVQGRVKENMLHYQWVLFYCTYRFRNFRVGRILLLLLRKNCHKKKMKNEKCFYHFIIVGFSLTWTHFGQQSDAHWDQVKQFYIWFEVISFLLSTQIPSWPEMKTVTFDPSIFNYCDFKLSKIVSKFFI